MPAKSLLVAFSSILIAVSLAAPASAEVVIIKKPKVGGKLLDGCYSWPGPCNSKTQADVYCKQKGYTGVDQYVAVNKVGAFQTKRLGDGGTCTASCTVMTKVICVF